jgi:hypothetical protein
MQESSRTLTQEERNAILGGNAEKLLPKGKQR